MAPKSRPSTTNTKRGPVRKLRPGSAKPPPERSRAAVGGGNQRPDHATSLSRCRYFNSVTNPLDAPPAPAPVNPKRSHIARFQQYVDITNTTDQPIAGQAIMVPDVDAPLIISSPGEVTLGQAEEPGVSPAAKAHRRRWQLHRQSRRAVRTSGTVSYRFIPVAPPSGTSPLDYYPNGGRAVDRYAAAWPDNNTCGTLFTPYGGVHSQRGAWPPADAGGPFKSCPAAYQNDIANWLSVSPTATNWSIAFTRTYDGAYRYRCIDADGVVTYDSGSQTYTADPALLVVGRPCVESGGLRTTQVLFCFSRSSFPGVWRPNNTDYQFVGFVADDNPPDDPLPPFNPNDPIDYSIELSGYSAARPVFDSVRQESGMVTLTYTGSTLTNAGQTASVQMSYNALANIGDFPTVAQIRDIQGSYSGPLKHGTNGFLRPCPALVEWRALTEVSPADADVDDWQELPVLCAAFEGLEPGQSIRIQYVGVWSFETRAQIFGPDVTPTDTPSFQTAIAVLSRVPNCTANGTHLEYLRNLAVRFGRAAVDHIMADPVVFAGRVLKGISFATALLL